MKLRQNKRSGFTLIEMMVVIGISSMVLYTMTTAVQAIVGTYNASTASMNLEARGGRAMRRIADALRGTDVNLLAVVPAPPFSASTILFQDMEAFSGTVAAPSAPRTITMVGDTIVWTESPGTADERSSVWSDYVPALLDGEILNGGDDNGNGLFDEAGMCFAREGSLIRIWLTLTNEDGSQSRTWSTAVECRN